MEALHWCWCWSDRPRLHWWSWSLAFQLFRHALPCEETRESCSVSYWEDLRPKNKRSWRTAKDQKRCNWVWSFWQTLTELLETFDTLNVVHKNIGNVLKRMGLLTAFFMINATETFSTLYIIEFFYIILLLASFALIWLIKIKAMSLEEKVFTTFSYNGYFAKCPSLYKIFCFL